LRSGEKQAADAAESKAAQDVAIVQQVFGDYIWLARPMLSAVKPLTFMKLRRMSVRVSFSHRCIAEWLQHSLRNGVNYSGYGLNCDDFVTR